MVSCRAGSAEVYFGPAMPPGQVNYWTRAGRKQGLVPELPLYGPLEPITSELVLNDIEKVN